MKKISINKAKSQKNFPHNWMILISILEISIRITEAFGLFFLPASIVTIISGSKIMFSILFARILLKKKIEKRDIVTLVLMISGIGFVGYSGYVKTKDKNNVSKLTVSSLLIGIPIVLLSNMLSSLLYVLFEKVLKKKKTDPLRFCAMSGSYGILTNFFLITIASFIPCFNSKMCKLGGPLEDPIKAISDIKETPKIKFLMTIYMIVMPLFIYSLMYVTKNVGAVYLTVTKNIYCITIWALSVVIGLEAIELKSFFLELTGFFLIILGTLVYNRVLFDKKEIKRDVFVAKEVESSESASLEKNWVNSESEDKDF